MSKKCTPLWREAHFEVNMYKNTTCSRHFCFAWQAQRIVHLVKSEQKREGFAAFPDMMAGVGHLKRIFKDAFSRGRCSTKDMFIRDVRRSGRSFPDRGCILEHQIFRFAEMILRDRCNPSYDLASIFRGRRSTLHRWSGKIAKLIGTRLPQRCTQLSIFEGSLAELLCF